MDSTKAQAAAAQASVEQQIAHVKSLQATLGQDKADQQASEAQADQTADNLRRQQDLYNHRVVSIQDLTNSRDSNRSVQANLDSAKMKVLSAEAQVPPEHATGNYVKVVQRVPVKILFDPIPDVGLPLGPGDSVVPTVKVQDFRYSSLQLMIAAASTGAAILGAFCWGTRPPKAKKEA